MIQRHVENVCMAMEWHSMDQPNKYSFNAMDMDVCNVCDYCRIINARNRTGDKEK